MEMNVIDQLCLKIGVTKFLRKTIFKKLWT